MSTDATTHAREARRPVTGPAGATSSSPELAARSPGREAAATAAASKPGIPGLVVDGWAGGSVRPGARGPRSPRPALGARALLTVLVALAPAACAAPEPEWTPLFNGEDLEGWTPKIRGTPAGADPFGTFRVEDGLLTVGYEGYDGFGARFGHLFYREPFSHYRLLVEYRFIGRQVAGGPEWAFKNSGVMLHAQAPESMLAGQDFPISLEAQLLGGNGRDPRPTANLCTPGTHVRMEGELVERHCTESASATFHGDEWVTVELLVLGDSLIAHLVNGDTVLTYGRPVVGGGVVDGFDPAAKPDGAPLTRGYVALQSESHPIQFRRVLVQRLDAGRR